MRPRITIEEIKDDQMGDDCCYYWKTFDNFVDGRPLEITFYHDGELESISHHTLVENGKKRIDIVPFGKTQVIVVTDLQTDEVLVTGAPQVCEARAEAGA